MLSVLRIVVGLVFFSAGTMKMFGAPASPQPIPGFDPATTLGIAAMLEVVGGALIVVGLFTRPVAFVLAGEMAVAYFTVHFPQSPFPTANGGMPPVLFCFLFLYFCFSGAGPWSLDGWIANHRAVKGDWGYGRRPEAMAGTGRRVIIGNDLRPIER